MQGDAYEKGADVAKEALSVASAVPPSTPAPKKRRAAAEDGQEKEGTTPLKRPASAKSPATKKKARRASGSTPLRPRMEPKTREELLLEMPPEARPSKWVPKTLNS